VFKLFKRPSVQTEQLVLSQPISVRERRKIPREFSTAYDVTEGNGEADWQLWEESVSFQDSKMHLTPHSLVPARASEIVPNVQIEVTDAFESVLKRAP
jgi:hypothetical protein